MYTDITERDHTKVKKLDLYIAGFPCQSFSIGGKRKGFDDVRGTLFFNVAEFIKINQPESFILENVKGLLSHDSGRTFQTITDLLSNGGGTVNGQMSLDFFEDGLGYHIHHKVLNSKECGIPQNRERIFIVGFKKDRYYSFPKPEPLKIKLGDLLEKEVEDKYLLSDKAIIKCLKSQANKTMLTDDTPEVCQTLIAAYHKIPFDGQYIKLDSEINVEVENKIDYDNIIATYRHSFEGFKGYKNICPTIKSSEGSGNQIVINNFRKLTPLECWRIQGFPDEVFFKAQSVNSDTQLYKQAGNSITVQVMEKVIDKIYNSNKN